MAEKHRLNDQPFTCHNRNYQTDIRRGYPHGVGNAKGSVFPDALVNTGHSLWLEYVTGVEDEVFWLMWYDPNGSPTIPLSGIFHSQDIQTISRGLASFIQVP